VYNLKAGAWDSLPPPDPTAVNNAASGINDRGQIFGIWNDSFFFVNLHGWVYEKGKYTFFDAPGASPDGLGTNVGGANNRGDVVGYYEDAEGGLHGFIRYGQSGRIDSIDVPDAQPGSTRANSINDQRTIVGSYRDEQGVGHGFVYKLGQFTTVDVSGYENTVVTGINNRGDLVGIAYNSYDEPSVAFIATPTRP
jgi:hypothetical protein